MGTSTGPRPEVAGGGGDPRGEVFGADGARATGGGARCGDDGRPGRGVAGGACGADELHDDESKGAVLFGEGKAFGLVGEDGRAVVTLDLQAAGAAFGFDEERATPGELSEVVRRRFADDANRAAAEVADGGAVVVDPGEPARGEGVGVLGGAPILKGATLGLGGLALGAVGSTGFVGAEDRGRVLGCSAGGLRREGVEVGVGGAEGRREVGPERGLGAEASHKAAPST